VRAPKKGSLLRELPIIIVAALVVSVVVKTFLIHFFYIPSGSMENTLQVGDRIAVNKLASYFSDIKRGEVVVFRDPAGWLGAPVESTDPKFLSTIKSGLVTVGVLPDPAKQYLIKRTIGVGGDTVKCCDAKGFLTVNGKSINEPYIFTGNKPSDSDFKVTVPKGFIWVMGDHRGASADSRFHTDDIHKGMVPLSSVVGRAAFVVWPFNHVKFLSVGSDLSKVAVTKSK
jgi:signal peptidase I